MVLCLPATRAVYSRFVLCTCNPELALMTMATSANVKKYCHPLATIQEQLKVILYAMKPSFAFVPTNHKSKVYGVISYDLSRSSSKPLTNEKFLATKQHET